MKFIAALGLIVVAAAGSRILAVVKLEENGNLHGLDHQTTGDQSGYAQVDHKNEQGHRNETGIFDHRNETEALEHQNQAG